MGLIRKTMSVGTMGVVSYRTDKQAAKRNARLVRRHDRAQSALLAHQSIHTRQQTELQRAMLAAQVPTPEPIVPTVPGWYPDPMNPRHELKWDGAAWTGRWRKV